MHKIKHMYKKPYLFNQEVQTWRSCHAENIHCVGNFHSVEMLKMKQFHVELWGQF